VHQGDESRHRDDLYSAPVEWRVPHPTSEKQPAATRAFVDLTAHEVR